MTRRAIPACLAVVATLPIACSSASSNGVPTNQITATFSVQVDPLPNNSGLNADFTKGDAITGTNIQFAQGDSVTYQTPSQPTATPLDFEATGYFVKAMGVLNTGDTVAFTVTRTDGTSAPSSTVVVPPALALTAPTDMMSVSYAGGAVALPVTWSTAMTGATVSWVQAQPCSGSRASSQGGGQVSDTGAATLHAADLLDGPPAAGGSCVVLTFRRTVNGTVDPAFGPASGITAYRESTVHVVVVP